jgi:uncharacterized protein (DUF849 family)
VTAGACRQRRPSFTPPQRCLIAPFEPSVSAFGPIPRAAARGHGIRTGLEDTPVLPGGREASGNAELAAAGILAELAAR